MIDIFEGLNWLNVIDNKSDLPMEARRLIQSARVVTRSDASVIRILDRLQSVSESSTDAREKAEILLNISAIEHWRGWSPDAVRHAKEAVNGYKYDDHRRAVARWILGMALWASLQNDQAYRNWSLAKKLFSKRRKLFIRFPFERSWYEDKRRRMEIDLASKPEEILTWLNKFDASALTPSSSQAVQAAQKNRRQGKYLEVNSMLRDLQWINKWSSEPYEKAEVLLECGFSAYQMGNLDSTTEFLKNAVAAFSPGIGKNHKQVIARCMLGAIEWMDERRHNQATMDWRRCIHDLEQLRLQADNDNQQYRKKWYAHHCDILQAALAERLPQTPPPRRKPKPPPARAPAPTPNQPSGSSSEENPVPEQEPPMDDGPAQIPNSKAGIKEPTPSPPISQQYGVQRYQDLVSMVTGDRAVADRLIEYERKLFPHERFEKLIERAIERLLRDRR